MWSRHVLDFIFLFTFILVFEESFYFFSAPRQWKLSYIEDLLETLGLSFRVKKVKAKYANAYAFIIRKEDRQSVRKYSEVEYDSYYCGHRVRFIHGAAASI